MQALEWNEPAGRNSSGGIKNIPPEDGLRDVFVDGGSVPYVRGIFHPA
jgi:hypothetical protein